MGAWKPIKLYYVKWLSFVKHSIFLLGLGRYSHYLYNIDTEINRYISIWSAGCTDTDYGNSRKKQQLFRTQNYSIQTWLAYNLAKDLSISSLNLIMLNYYFVNKTMVHNTCCLSTSICWIHCIDWPKTFNLLLKFNIIDFETLSRVHGYCIEYVSYRQYQYQIRIDTAADRTVLALIFITKVEVTLQKANKNTYIIRIRTSKMHFYSLTCWHICV